MESEINALDHSCIELFPIIDITISLGKEVGMTIGDTTVNVSIQKDNAGALILAKNFHHNSFRAASIMCPRPSGLVKRLTQGGSNSSRLILLIN